MATPLINQHPNLLDLYLFTAGDFTAALVCKEWNRRIIGLTDKLSNDILERIERLVGERNFALMLRRVTHQHAAQGKVVLKKLYASLYNEAAILQIPWNSRHLIFDEYQRINRLINIQNTVKTLKIFQFGQEFLELDRNNDLSDEEKAEQFFDWVKRNPILLSVRELSLNNCGITRIPSYVFLMTKLVALNVADNNISYFPHEIENLKKIEHLNCDGNPIHQAPKELGELKNLTDFTLLSKERVEQNYRDPGVKARGYKQEIDIEEGLKLPHNNTQRELQETARGTKYYRKIKEDGKSIVLGCGILLCACICIAAIVSTIVLAVLLSKKD
jgi:hypothetical protein